MSTITRDGIPLTDEQQKLLFSTIPSRFRASELETRTQLLTACDAGAADRLADALIRKWKKEKKIQLVRPVWVKIDNGEG